MFRFSVAGAGALTCLLAAGPALAHAVAGPRVFVGTLTVDDPGVADEIALPTVTYQRQGAGDGPGPSYNVNISGEFDKTITEDFGVGIATGYNIVRVLGDKTHYGWDNVELSAKYHVYTNAEHEFIASVGVIREIGSSGTNGFGDRFGSTTPTLYFGKGFGDLPIGPLRALAVTGTLGYQFSDVPLRSRLGVDPATGAPTVSYNAGNNSAWVAGLTLQYSIPYLQSQVKDYGLPGWLARLTPLVEFTYTTPATRPSNSGTLFTIAPGVVYSADAWQLAIEAIIPGNTASGTNIGVIAQVHLYLDDLLPNSLGKPIFGK